MVTINLVDYPRLSRSSISPEVEAKSGIETVSVKGGKIDVLTADGRRDNDGHTIILTEPYSGYVGRLDDIVRHKVIASQLGARVIAIDNIGVGIGTSHRIPDGVYEGLNEGNFTALALLQWEALLSRENILEDGSLSIVGNSLGVASAAALAATAPEDKSIDRLVLIEGVSQPGSLGSLAMRFISEMNDWGDYKNNNDPVYRELQRKARLSNFGRWAYIYANALTNPRVGLDIMKAVQQQSFSETAHLDIVNGSRSRVSPTTDNEMLARQCRLHTDGTFGSPDMLHTVLRDESHGIIDDLSKYAHLLGLLLTPRG